MTSKYAELESLLFISGNEGITLHELEQLTNIAQAEILEALETLSQKYEADQKTALKLIHAKERYRLVTKKEVAELVKQYFESPAMTELSNAALETLAVVAYKQPVTRIQIDEVRGVNSSGMLQKLLVLDLIKEAGRLDAPGRPIMYKTTENFLNYFGIESLKQLPALPDPDTKEDDPSDLLSLFNDALEE